MHILPMKGRCPMDSKNTTKTTDYQNPSNSYDDGNIPKEDLPGKNVIPDEVPRKDGPGGEGK